MNDLIVQNSNRSIKPHTWQPVLTFLGLQLINLSQLFFPLGEDCTFKKYNCEFCPSDLGFSGDCLINILLLFHPYGSLEGQCVRGCEKKRIPWLGGEREWYLCSTHSCLVSELLGCILGRDSGELMDWWAEFIFLTSGVPPYIYNDLTSSVA